MRLLLGVALGLLLAAPLPAAEDEAMRFGVGELAPEFTLVSHQDRTFDYVRDIYGRHHLILTFFPAAFTPV